ncbi:MAG: helix-turn-helix domain-containing protein [Candidatus Levybacteria bacterium]|nr:helix-turn-helix domain-containing protein [Candidatus Levybacteria bacterium]
MTQTNFLTVKEVSILLKLSMLTIYKYIRDRKLEVIRFGGHYRIEKRSLDKFIDNHRIGESTNTYSTKEVDKADEI